MRQFIFVVSCLVIVTSACKKEGAAKGEAAVKPAAASTIDYAPIDALVKAAKTSDDFTNVLLECSKHELTAAASDGKQLSKDPSHIEHCRWAPVEAQAKLAIAESTPDKMSVSCLTASMKLDDLVTEDIHVADAKALNDKLKTSCGM